MSRTTDAQPQPTEPEVPPPATAAARRAPAEPPPAELVRHDPLVLLLDLDGTLIPYAATVEAATIDPPLRALFDDLASAGMRAYIVSGRPRAAVSPIRDALGGPRCFAEHGAWKCDESGRWSGPQPEPALDELSAILAPFAAVSGARIERKSLGLCLHWRLVDLAAKEELIAAAEDACGEWLEAHPDFERLEGVEMLEVRRRSANKGVAVAWVRANVPNARIIALGDDETDEDMFAALGPDDLAIGVGPRRTRTPAWLAGPPQVREFLGWLAADRSNRATAPCPPLERRPTRSPEVHARLLVVSNRTPPVARGRQRPVGGLVSALQPALAAGGGLWLGWNGAELEGERRLDIDLEAQPARAAFAFAPGWRERFYGGFCNRALWPLFHGFSDRVRYTDADWQAYVEVNAEFARRAHDIVAPDGTVWMHDYHLLLAGREMRRRGFRGPLGTFLHIPFPQRDLFATLPWATELLEAMLDFELIGFHTEMWAANFRECVRALCPSRTLPEIGVLPIGVDPVVFADGDSKDPEVAGLHSALRGRRMILGVDRLDYAKGIPERLLAFERLLEREPQWRGHVVLVQISVPSREEVPEYAELRQTVEKLVGRINGQYGEADWVPVRYLYRSYDHRVLAQLYHSADVALVTPLRDGLNLVAKEFVVAQDSEAPGVLVLSRFAGAAEELTEAVITNPFHPDGLATDLDRALRMTPEERRRRHAALRDALADQTPQRWAAAFLDRLLSVRRV